MKADFLAWLGIYYLGVTLTRCISFNSQTRLLLTITSKIMP
jgi:hypothetical protein